MSEVLAPRRKAAIGKRFFVVPLRDSARHTDFQFVALPTELWHLVWSFLQTGLQRWFLFHICKKCYFSVPDMERRSYSGMLPLKMSKGCLFRA